MSFHINSESIESERLDGEVIVISLSTGSFYSMSGAASDVWTLLEGGADAAQIETALSSVFAGEIPSGDIENFIAHCVGLGLIVEVEGQPQAVSTALPDDYVRAGYVTPTIGEFTDLQDLILVDPVHESSLLGWPHAAQGEDG